MLSKERALNQRLVRTYTEAWPNKINGIEAGRLDKQLQLLDRQKTHSIRIVNNDIRLTRIALEHIETSSGQSVKQEGFFGTDPAGSSAVFAAAFEASDKPMFLYGERQVSRRVGKVRRIQSAMVKGRSTSASSKTLDSNLNRPKSSIPSFSEIKDRVHRQMDINPDWDPNTELPYIPMTSEDAQSNVIRNNWVLESNPNTPATKTRPDRSKSGKTLNVSFQALKLAAAPADSASDDGGRQPDDVMTMIAKENMEMSKNKRNVRPASSALKTGKKVVTVTRSKSAQFATTKDSVRQHTNKSDDTGSVTSQESNSAKDDDEEKEMSAKQTRSAGGRLERNKKPLPKQRNPRDHPVAKLVGKTREAIGKAKKAQHSASFYDPETSELGSNLLHQKKQQAAKLARNKSKQSIENEATDVKVSEYFSKHPLGKLEEVDDPLVHYELMKADQKLKLNDSLFESKTEEEEYGLVF